MAAVPIPTAAKSGRVYGYKAARVAVSVHDMSTLHERLLGMAHDDARERTSATPDFRFPPMSPPVSEIPE